MFVIKEVNQSGIYVVKFVINGNYQSVTVDDYFPVNPDTNLPAFTRSTKKLIWPLILEKAWAKLNGSFENIMQGYPNDVLSFLITGPSIYIDFNRKEYNQEQLWKLLTQGFHDKHIMCGITRTSKALIKYGLVSNHCYSITN
jgi:calpain-15